MRYLCVCFFIIYHAVVGGSVCVENPDINKMVWLMGTWVIEKPQGNIYETWVRISDSEFSGKNYMVNGNDTILFETLQVIKNEAGIFYIPTVPDQNDGLPVTFSLLEMTDSSFVFENPSHDFPQRIAYTRISADELKAEVLGVQNGQELKLTFEMRSTRRIK
ncbi:MAG: DUF6265 family protein [Bacteroidales bacterium]|nr:DUF6265 family protein [Bacteroidales bacterium]